MATPKKAAHDCAAGERMFTEVFAMVQRRNAVAGKSGILNRFVV
jgi:hypothetical protein